MRPVIVAANWKMNTLPGEAGELARAVAAATNEPDVVRVICPPFVALRELRDALAGTDVAVGAQNVHWEQAGAFTGEVSAQMVAREARWAIVGHSERRRDQAETDERIGQKLRRCYEAQLRAIFCVGETLEEREAGRAETVVRGQIERAFDALGDIAWPGDFLDERDRPLTSWLVVAYEPVWAIGTGRNARGPDAAAMADIVRQAADSFLPAGLSADLPVLYGGSVTSATIREFVAEPALDGALVGGASLKVDEMAGIVASAGVTARARASAGAVT